MKTCIYQYWDGPDTPGNTAGVKAMRKYADAINAHYLYEHNPKFVSNLGRYSPHYGCFKPIFDTSFDQYDYVMFADTDVFPRDQLDENIFDQFDGQDIGICEEYNQPAMRKRYTIAGINSANDNRWCNIVEGRWGSEMPRTPQGDPRVFNSGVVVWSKQGRLKARERFIPFKQYVDHINLNGLPPFYTCDQPYLHAMIQIARMDWLLMDYKWNSSVHYQPGTKDPRPVIDLRDGHNMVHIQLSGADHYDDSKLYRITNLPVEMWALSEDSVRAQLEQWGI